jgi:hypothetical protein
MFNSGAYSSVKGQTVMPEVAISKTSGGMTVAFVAGFTPLLISIWSQVAYSDSLE